MGKLNVFLFLAITIMLSAGVLAFFTFSYDKDVTYEIVGSKGNLLILVDFTDQILNVSQSLNSTQDLTVVNQNGLAFMEYIIDTNVTNLDPGNCSATGDISFELEKQGSGVLNNGTSFNMSAGINVFNFTVSAINNRVCPQNVTASLSFTELP